MKEYYLIRKMEDVALDAVRCFPVISTIGPRRSGKNNNTEALVSIGK